MLSFSLDKKIFTMSVDIVTNITNLVDSENKKVFTINADNVLFKDKEELGRFYLDEKDLWCFKSQSGTITNTGNKRFSKAKLKLFKQFL